MLSFCSIGTRVGLIFRFSAVVPLNFLRVQNLYCRQSERKPLGRYGETRMHQDAALCASCRLARKADQVRLLALEAEVRRVMEDEDRSLRRRYAPARRLEMTAKNIRLVDPFVGEEAIGGLRVGPILTNQRDALTHVAPDLCEQFAEPATKPLILKLASRNFLINPRLDTSRQSLSTRPRASLHQAHRAPRASESGAQQGITTDSTDSRFRPPRLAQIRRQMWVIERCLPPDHRGTRTERPAPRTLVARCGACALEPKMCLVPAGQ
ncbi:hypothetical protein ACVIM5_000363 [Bradyrhizobium sp. USDA 4512]